MKVSVIGAGNVGGLAAMRIAQDGVLEVSLIDIAKGLSCGKALDIADSRALIKFDSPVFGTDDLANLEGSDIVVITAGFPRKPGMTREDLLNKNAQVIKELCLAVKKYASGSILIIVTNPLDLMTRLALKITGFNSSRVMGVGISLDAARFSNLIAEELNILPREVNAIVIGSHGEGMMPLVRLSTVREAPLYKLIDAKKAEELINKTTGRGLEIVSLLGSGSAYFAPSAAISSLVKSIYRDEKHIIGVSAYLNGEYGVKDVCIGVPCRLGADGIEQVLELDLNQEEKDLFGNSALHLKEQFNSIQ
ncbi:MAG: malate dehydrogenase [Candidatus Omnitrophica bacterium]|nr:malate dehydrogenase [Candidatus Omnitrophota bacterium]